MAGYCAPGETQEKRKAEAAKAGPREGGRELQDVLLYRRGWQQLPGRKNSDSTGTIVAEEGSCKDVALSTSSCDSDDSGEDRSKLEAVAVTFVGGVMQASHKS